MSRRTWCNYTGCLSGHECSLNSAHWCTPFTTKDLHRIFHQTLYRLLRQRLLAAVFDHLPLRTIYVVPRTLSKFGDRPFEYAGPAAWSRFPGHIRRQYTHATFRRHLFWKRFYSLKFLTLPRTFNIVTSAGHLCKWTQNRRRRWWSWCLFVRPSVTNIVNTTKEWSDFSVNAQVVHGARWNDQLQEVNDQGHTTPKLDLETWRSRHRRPLWSNRFSSFAIIAIVQTVTSWFSLYRPKSMPSCVENIMIFVYE